MPKYKAWVQLPNAISSSHLIVEIGEENDSTFEARRVLEAQYPGAKILNLSRIREPRELAAEREHQQEVAAGGAGLLLLAFGVIWFAPLIGLFGAIGYWEWTLTGTWHPLLRGLLILGSLLLTAWLIGFLLSQIARSWVSAIGAAAYAGAGLYLKYLNCIRLPSIGYGPAPLQRRSAWWAGGRSDRAATRWSSWQALAAPLDWR